VAGASRCLSRGSVAGLLLRLYSEDQVPVAIRRELTAPPYESPTVLERKTLGNQGKSTIHSVE
jgi:hypothetical protein